MNNMCACLNFCKRKVLLIMLLQVNIKDLIIFSAQTPGLRKRPRFEHIKNEKLSMKMIFFSKKAVIFIISNLFSTLKWKFPKSGKSGESHTCFNLHAEKHWDVQNYVLNERNVSFSQIKGEVQQDEVALSEYSYISDWQRRRANNKYICSWQFNRKWNYILSQNINV